MKVIAFGRLEENLGAGRLSKVLVKMKSNKKDQVQVHPGEARRSARNGCEKVSSDKGPRGPRKKI